MNAILPFPDIGPDLFSVTLFGMEFALRWYALAYIVGIVLGWRLIVALVKRPALWPAGQAPMRPAQVEELLTWVILGVIVGGRLGFVLFYRPGYYLSNPLEILALWQGGMSFHGGFLGVVVAAWIFCARQGIDRLAMADCLAIAAPAGLFLGRCANFVNAELWGKAWDGPWAMVFPTDPLQVPRHPSQLYEALLEGLVLGAVLLWLALRRGALKRPGLIAGLFLAGYGAARIFVEAFREADPQFITAQNPDGHVIGAAGFGLSMGQVLSLPMLLFGLALALYALRRGRAP